MRAVKVGLAVLLVSLLVTAGVAIALETINGQKEELPSFRPTISDKKGMRPTKSSPPLPESDLTHIVFPKRWLLENDEDESPDLIKITFPASWVDSPPKVDTGEQVVLLRVPKKMLKLDDSNEDPRLITIHYPAEWFRFHSDSEESNRAGKTHSLEHVNRSPSQRSIGIQAIEYQERVWFRNELKHRVIHATGVIDPYYFYNAGETFRTFHEREVYLNRSGDLIEFISDFADDGKAWVWVAVFDENVWVTPPDWLSVEVTGTLQRIEYRFYMNQPGYYDIWLYDTKTGNWYHNSYDDTDNPPAFIEWLTGSTEIDTLGGILKDFEAHTYPVTTDWVWIGGSSKAHRPNEFFKKYPEGPDEPYVYVDGWFDGGGRIITNHFTSDDV